MNMKRCPTCKATEVVEVLGQILDCPVCGTELKEVIGQIFCQEVDGALAQLEKQLAAERGEANE